MKRILTAVLVFACSLSLFAQKLRVEAPAAVGLDERFNVTFIIEGEERPSSFEWNESGDFRVEWGPQTGTSTSISVINGKRTKTSQTTYTYILSPKSKGKFRLPAARAVLGGKEISSEPHDIEVVSEGASASSSQASPSGQAQGRRSSPEDIPEDDLFLRLTLSKRDVVVGEPIVATLKLYERVTVTGFEDARFPAFNGFWSQETASSSNIQFSRESLDDRIYDAAVIRTFVLVPQKAGDLRIDPAELVCLVNVRTQSRPMSIFDEFFDSGYRTVRKRIATPAATVHVRPVPPGAPASYGGGVGTFSIDAKLSRDRLKANDAASLTVTVSGTGNVSLLGAPQVNFHPDTEVYDVKVTDNSDRKSGSLDGSKTFEYPFIPRSHGEFTIPPVEYSYYDVKAGRYVTLRTPELKYTVEKNGGSAAAAGGGNTLGTVERKGVKNLAEDIRYISRRMPEMKKNPSFLVASGTYYSIAALLLVLAAAAWAVFRKMAAVRADTALMKNRKASRAASKRLARARDYMDRNLSAAFYEELHKALLGYVSDKFGISPDSLSRDTISVRMTEAAIPEELTGSFIDLLDACEYARYAPSSGTEVLNAHYASAVELISTIDSSMKNKRTGFRQTMAVFALLLVLPASLSASDAETLWNEGSAAYTEGRWEDAARSWESLLDEGYRDAVIYYNTGNAWYKAGEYPKAVLNYERALKEDASFTDARFNLSLAQGGIQDRIDELPELIFKTWMRSICRVLSSDLWAVSSLIFLAAALAMLLLFLLGSGSGARRTGFYSAIAAMLLCVFSFSMARWQYGDYRDASHAIVMSPVSSVKSSPSSGSAKDLFVLHGGVKVRILDTVGEWTNIMLSDGRQGWVLTGDLETI